MQEHGHLSWRWYRERFCTESIRMECYWKKKLEDGLYESKEPKIKTDRDRWSRVQVWGRYSVADRPMKKNYHMRFLTYIDMESWQGSIIDGYSIFKRDGNNSQRMDKEQNLLLPSKQSTQKSVKSTKSSSTNPNLWYPLIRIDPWLHTTKSASRQGNIIYKTVIMTTNIETGNFNLICNRK